MLVSIDQQLSKSSGVTTTTLSHPHPLTYQSDPKGPPQPGEHSLPTFRLCSIFVYYFRTLVTAALGADAAVKQDFVLRRYASRVQQTQTTDRRVLQPSIYALQHVKSFQSSLKMVGTPQSLQPSAFDAHTSTGSPIPPIPSIFSLASPVPNTDALNLSSHFQALLAEEQENAANEAWISLHTNSNQEDLITRIHAPLPRSDQHVLIQT